MIKVESYTDIIDGEEKTFARIIANRGDKGSLFWDIDTAEETKYEFQPGDKVDFTVFEKQGYDKTPVIEKSITVSQATESVEIELTEEDTSFSEPINKPETYWYEISLNKDVVNGYDYEEGAMEFILLPGKAGEL